MIDPGLEEGFNTLEKYSIKVSILNRLYPLLVKAEEEAAVRNAAKLINDKIKVYKERFSVKDDIDLVIMCCLELATDNLHQAGRNRAAQGDAEARLQRLAAVLDEALAGSQP